MVQALNYSPLMSLARSQGIVQEGLNAPLRREQIENEMMNSRLRNLLASREMNLRGQRLDFDRQRQGSLDEYRNQMLGLRGLAEQRRFLEYQREMQQEGALRDMLQGRNPEEQADLLIQSGNPDLIKTGISLRNAIKPKGRNIKYQFDSTYGRVVGVDQDTGELIDPAMMVAGNQQESLPPLPTIEENLSLSTQRSPTLMEDISASGSVSGPVGSVKSGLNYIAGIFGSKPSDVNERRNNINDAMKRFLGSAGISSKLKAAYQDIRDTVDVEPDVFTNDVLLADKMLQVDETLAQEQALREADIADPNIPKKDKVESRRDLRNIKAFRKKLGVNPVIKGNQQLIKSMMADGHSFEDVVKFLEKRGQR